MGFVILIWLNGCDVLIFSHTIAGEHLSPNMERWLYNTGQRSLLFLCLIWKNNIALHIWRYTIWKRLVAGSASGLISNTDWLYSTILLRCDEHLQAGCTASCYLGKRGQIANCRKVFHSIWMSLHVTLVQNRLLCEPAGEHFDRYQWGIRILEWS